MRGGKHAAIVVAITCALVAPARADRSPGDEPSLLDPRYLIDGGALPLFWGALVGRLALDHFATPRDMPLYFSSTEGGAPPPPWEVPGWAVTTLAVPLGVGMLATHDGARFYHLKGLAETLMTGATVTAALKVLVGRHRPDWSLTNDGSGERRSFPSGHATQAFEIGTYGVLFLHDHVFDGSHPVLEGAAYAAIGLGAVSIAAERVYHNQHHVSDVVVGGLLGTATSTLLYLYQERRFRAHARREAPPVITPTFTNGVPGLGVRGSF